MPADPALVARLRAAGSVFAEEEADLLTAAAASPAELTALVARRVAGEPLEQVLGWTAFYGLRVQVEPGVFVPRRRTELLAREAIATAYPGAAVVDLCCGSGAVGLAVATHVPGVELHAADVDPVAVRCARRNLAALGQVHHGDLFDALPAALRGHVDVLVVNGPYVPTDAIALMPPEARDHEPARALDGGPDGLAVLRRVVAEAPRWLAPGGRVLVECADRQTAAIMAAVHGAGLRPRLVHDDEVEALVAVGVAEENAHPLR
jgi:release factor glutamine methyltransferase